SASPSIDEHGHELTLRLPEEPITVSGDAARLSQVIVNLLMNAAQYTAGGGHITLTLEQHGKAALIRVKDDGIGIAPDMLSRIFDMFTQADQQGVGPRRGLGIGLTIAQRLIEMHG